MSDSLSFDTDTAVRLERLYTAADVQRRRKLATSALSLNEGDRVLDIGCGPGFHTEELAHIVGATGGVIGVDISEAMLTVARNRCSDLPNASFRSGSAVELPVPSRSIDAVVAVQVLEYVQDIPQALQEIRRVLHPGGRAAIIDIDWETVSWHSTNPERMRQVLATWDKHLAHPSLPAWLKPALIDAGFTNVTVQGHSFVNTTLDPDGYSFGLLPIISDFVRERLHQDDAISAWTDEQQALARTDEFFFSVTKFLFTATVPTTPTHA